MSYSCRCFPVLWKWNVRTHCQKSSSFITWKNLEHFQSRIKPVQRFLKATKPRPRRMGSLSTAWAADSNAKRSTILPCESQILTCRTPVQVSNTHILRILPGQLHMLVLHLASLCPCNTVPPMCATYSSLRWRLCSKPTLRGASPDLLATYETAPFCCWCCPGGNELFTMRFSERQNTSPVLRRRSFGMWRRAVWQQHFEGICCLHLQDLYVRTIQWNLLTLWRGRK